MNDLGPERYQSDRFIRKLLHLADARNTDIFYDLGCGIGQLCIVAVTEFDVRKAVGIELHRGRAKKAEKRVKELCSFNKGVVWHNSLDDYLNSFSGSVQLESKPERIEERDLPKD